jgi:hypothetical protein
MNYQKIIAKGILLTGLAGIVGCSDANEGVLKQTDNISEIGVATGDMNNDGKTDIVVAGIKSGFTENEVKIYVYINNGDGTYTAQENKPPAEKN